MSEYNEVLDDFRLFESHRTKTKWDKRAKDGYGFYFGDGQWDENVKTLLAQKNRPASVYNNILPAVDTIIGHQIGNRVDLIPSPVDNHADVYTADLLANCIKHIERTNGIEYERRAQFFDGLATGLGVKEFWHETRYDTSGEIKCEQKSPWYFYLDPDFERYDYTDAHKLFRVKWVTKRDAEQIYGKDAMKGIMFPTATTYENFIAVTARPTLGEASNYGAVEGFTDEVAEDLGYDVKGKRVRVIEQYERLEKDLNLFYDTTTGEFIDYDMLSEIEQTMITKDMTIQLRDPYIKLTTVVGHKVIEKQDLRAKEFYHLFNLYFPYFANGKFMGIIDNLISPQEEINKRHSTVTDFLSRIGSGGYWVERGAFNEDSEASIQHQLSKNNMVIFVDQLNDDRGFPRIRPREFQQIPTIFERLLDREAYDIKHTANVENPIQGIHQGKQSGTAKRTEIEQSAIRLQGIIDNFRRTQYLEGKAMLFWIQNYMNDETIIRIMGERLGEADRQVVINHEFEGTKWNDVSVGKYDIKLVFEGKTEGERERLQYKILEMGSNDPQNADIYNEIILRNSDFPEKEEILEKIQQRQMAMQQQSMMAMQQGGAQSAPRPSRGVRRVPQQQQ